MKKELDTAHYDIYETKLSPEEIKTGTIRLDPYRVAEEWRLGERDFSGCFFHILKTLARNKEGNTLGREIQSIKASIARKEELYNEKG